MSDLNKRKNNEERNNYKNKPLVKLGVKSNERYDSYGHILDDRKHEVPNNSYAQKTPGRQTERTGASSYKTKSASNTSRSTSKERIGAQSNRSKSSNNNSRAASTERNISQKESLEKNKSEKNIKSDSRISSRGDSKRKVSKFTEKDEGIETSKWSKTKKLKVDEDSPHERRLKEKKPKKRKKINNGIKIAILLLVVAITVGLFWYGRNANNDIRTAFLSTGIIENTCNAKVSVIRKEKALTAGFSGRVVAEVNEGDRVAAGTVVAYVVKPEYESELVALRKIEDKISAAQGAATYVESEHAELSALNTQIYEMTKKLAMMGSNYSSFSGFSDTIQQLELLFETKNEILMNSETTDAYITELKNQRTAILSNLDSYMKEVVSDTAGVVSFYADSKCDEATNKANEITEYVNKKGETGNYISESTLAFSEDSMKNMIGAEVSAGQVVAKVTPDVEYYLSAEIALENASSFYPGKSVSVRTKDRTFVVEGQVVEVMNFGEKIYLLMKSSSGINGTVSERTIESQIVIDSSKGLKVPKRSLTEWDSAGLTARITILRSNYVSYVFVNVLAEDGEYAIISSTNDFVSEDDEGVTSVRVNDIYVVNYELVTEGQIIGG